MGGDLDWANNPYEVNPRQWSGIYSNANPTVWYNNATLAQSIPDFTTNSCTALGGVNPRTGTTHPQSTAGSNEGSICLLNNVPFLSVVQELSTYRAFAQFDTDLDETMKFHTELSFTKTDAPNIRQPASGGPAAAQAPLEAGGTGYPAACSATLGRCSYAIPYNHPAFADFLSRANVGRPSQLVTGTAGVGQTSIGTGPLWSGYWRPFGYGGRYEGEPWTLATRKEDNWRGTMQLTGEFSDGGMFGLGRFLPAGTTYDFAVSGASRKGTVTNPDVVSWKLQEAMNGFGGPDCQAPDLTPTVLPGHGAPFTAAEIAAFNASIGTQNAAAAGKNGCMWFNPFASAFPSNAATGATNPSYNAALANDPELVKWLFTDGTTQSRYQELNMDFHIGGDVPGFEAPGGPINWGIGGQWRQYEYENRGIDPYVTPRYYDCPWDPWIPPGQMRQSVGGIGCDRTTNSGAGVGALMSRSVRATRITDRQTIAGYGELHVPVLDNLSVSGTARYEEISGSIGDWVYSASFKWDIFDWVAFRGSYSDNFASPNPDVLDNDGLTEVGIVGGTGGPSVPVTTIVDPNLDVERTKQFSAGFIFQTNDLFFEDSRLRANIDYFNYFIDGEISTLGGSTIVTRAFPAVGTGTGAIVDTGQPRVTGGCSSPLFMFITLASPCVDPVIVNRIVQNPATATDITDILAVNSLVLNGPGIKQAGVDFTVDYTLPAFGGQLGVGVRGTRILEYKSKAAFYNGIQIPLSLAAGFGGTEDYLGNANIAQFFGTGKQGARWRASAYANYATDDMNFRWTTRLVSAVDDERGCYTYAGNGSLTGGGTTCFGVDGEDHYVSDFSWTWDTPFVEDFQLRFSVLNVFDKNPAPLSGGEGTGAVYFPSLPYNAYVSSPLGRQFEIGFSKTF